MPQTVFLRVIETDDRAEALLTSVAGLRSGKAGSGAYALEPDDFFKVPGAPFAYWVNDRIRSLFTELPPFEGEGRTVKVGLQTSDDFRFVRAWWEVPAETIVTGTEETTPEKFRQQTFEGKRWVPFAKGGAYSPFYADLHLVINWSNDGAELRSFPPSVIRNPDFYFRPGITWPRRTQKGFSARALPAGAIFADKGPSVFCNRSRLLSTLAVMNSTMFTSLLRLQMAFGSYEVGVIQRTPVPTLDAEAIKATSDASKQYFGRKMLLSSVDETQHVFLAPSLLQAIGATLKERFDNWNLKAEHISEELNILQARIHEGVTKLYSLTSADVPDASQYIVDDAENDDATDGDIPMDEDYQERLPDAATALASYALGLVFGRWDGRLVLEGLSTGGPADPFAPLPATPLGALQKRLTNTTSYPFPVQWSGIIADDEGKPEDITNLLVLSLHTLLPAIPDAEDQLCNALAVTSLRDFVRSRFFGLHTRQYSKSKRKAPIYWQLRSPKRLYGLWLYYHRLGHDTLYVALRDYVEPKLAYEQEMLEALRGSLSTDASRATAKRVEAQEELVQDLVAFHQEIKAVADAGYDPDLNDGVLINIAPLHRLVQWKEAEVCYRDLKAGKYPWASMSQRYKFR